MNSTKRTSAHREAWPRGSAGSLIALLILMASGVGAVTAPAFAASHVVTIDWDNSGRFAHGAVVAAGKFVEICGRLPRGASIRWQFESSAPLDFNIHYHVGKDTVFPVRLGGVTSERGTLSAEVDEHYCWMWTNKSASGVRVSAELRR